MPKSNYVILWDHPSELVAGIYVGNCVNPDGKLASNHNAHAHYYPTGGTIPDPYGGWICVRPSQLDRMGTVETVELGKTTVLVLTKPGELACHELAHITAPVRGHGYGWQSHFAKHLIANGLPPDVALNWHKLHRRQRPPADFVPHPGTIMRIAANSKPIELRGERVRVERVMRTRAVVSFIDRPINRKWAYPLTALERD